MKTFSEYITYREGDGESGFSLNGYFHTTPKMGHGAQNQAESRLMEAEEAEEAPSKTKKVFVSIPKGGRTSLPHRPVVSREVSLRNPSAEKTAVSVIQTIHKLNGKTSKDLTPEQQEFLSSYKSIFPRGPNIPLNPDQFRSLMKLKKSFPDMFKS